LLAEVRRVVASATTRIALGDDELEDEVLSVVANFDGAIKMIARPDPALRRRFGDLLRERLADPDSWRGPSYLTVARQAALALPLEERVDHMAGVFLGTGVIQVTDVVTHALIALAQHPEAADVSDAALVQETLRMFPVNASFTRLVAADASIGGDTFRRGEAVTVVPARVNRRLRSRFEPGRNGDGYAFTFGVGVRGCPARRVALLMAETLVGRYRALGVTPEPGYRHRRSLAQAARVLIGPGVPPAPTPRWDRAKSWARYVRCCSASYPRAFALALPEIAAIAYGR
jgi:cytochrome P450